MNKKFFIPFLFFILEAILLYLYYSFGDLKNLLELQKLFLEILILFVGILSGKLIYEAINYIKEKRVKNIDDLSKKILEYDTLINDILSNLTDIKERTDFNIAKVFILLHTAEKIVYISSNNDNKVILMGILNHIKFKLFYNLKLKGFLKGEGNKYRFSQSLNNQLLFQLKDKEFINNFLESMNDFVKP